MPSPALVDATDLTVWANRRDAQERLPHLVRRLVLTTASGITRLHFRAGDGVQLPGWDGIAEVRTGNAFIPDGLSVWEMGTAHSAGSKAQDDYNKRSKNPLGINPAEAAFVFVTPRRWSGKEAWATERARDARWREVRAYDADDLEAWLEMSPAVHAWISALLGRSPEATQDLATYWTNWVQATSPPLSTDLVTAGRDELTEQVLGQLAGPPGALALRADSRVEALAFLCASIDRLPDADREAVLARGLVLSNEAAWRRVIAATEQPLVLVPVFEGADAAEAVRVGHHVLIPLGREAPLSTNVIELPRLRRQAAEAVLLAMGVPDERAGALATLARRSLLSLRRRLALSPEIQQPVWARPENAHMVLPALLAGAWDDSKAGDREVVAALADRPYEDVARDLTRWANESDPPLRKVGTTWFLVSKEDAWTLLARFFTVDDLRRFRDAALTVLGSTDPALDLPADQRWAANVLGHARPQSQQLREGLSDTLALMAARSASTPLVGDTGQQHADHVVHELLTRVNKDESGVLWASVSDELPLLAEAAPEPFLTAVDAGLSGEQVLRHVFADADPQSAFFVSSPHTGLLWALERLAWSPEHLGRVALQLARLVRLDPGGRLSNRPDNSLSTVFHLQYPQTTAPLDRRLDVLDVLCEREPDVAWRLLVELLPSHLGMLLPTHGPRWREWKPDDQPTLTPDPEWPRGIEEVIDRLLADVGIDGRRWSDLINAVGSLPKDTQDAVLERLLTVDVAAFDQAGRAAVRDTTRTVVSRHRRFPNAAWAMPTGQVDRLAEAYRRFDWPDDPVGQNVWLFTDRPDLPDVSIDDVERYSQAIHDARVSAARVVHQRGGLPALLDLATSAKRPDELGRVLGEAGLEAEEEEVLALLAAADQARRQLALGYVAGRFAAGGWDWAEATLGRGTPDRSPEARAGFLIGLPRAARAWDWAERLGEETERAYWSQFGAWGLAEPAGATRAATKLLVYGRPYAAVDLLGIYVDQGPAPGLVADALEGAAGTPLDRDADPAMLAYYVAQLLNYVEASGAVDDARLARLEWAYLPLLRYGDRPPKLLHLELTRDPEFFVEVVSWVYRAENEESREATEEQRVRAQLGEELLDSWREVPGRRDDGSIDAEVLASWVARARELLADSGRSTIGDQRIGRMLRYGPSEVDGVWPDAAIRQLIEAVASLDLETGLEAEVFNSRGVTTRGPVEGGQQERELADRYAGYAAASDGRWPRTAAMLRRIASVFEADARREDAAAELREDLGR